MKRKSTQANGAGRGLGVDYMGGPVVDPTQNVTDLVLAEARRQDDLRNAAKELSDAKHEFEAELTQLRAGHNADVGKLREEYQEKIQKAESGRLDSIRQVDREEVAKTAVAANTAITTLAKQTTDLQQTLAKQVTDTAAAAEIRFASINADMNKRVSAVELALSEGKGKQQVSDPAFVRLADVVERLAGANQIGTGKAEGISDVAKMLIGAMMLITGLMGIYTFTQRASTVTPPQVIVVPAPVNGIPSTTTTTTQPFPR